MLYLHEWNSSLLQTNRLPNQRVNPKSHHQSSPKQTWFLVDSICISGQTHLICKYKYICTYYLYMYIDIFVMCVSIYIYTYIYIFIHIYIHNIIHIYIYVYKGRLKHVLGKYHFLMRKSQFSLAPCLVLEKLWPTPMSPVSMFNSLLRNRGPRTVPSISCYDVVKIKMWNLSPYVW
jgi:hypothetical protein